MSTYSIGDAHGMADKVINLVTYIIETDPDFFLVFHGDYIDRGPQSMQVIEFLIQLQQQYPGRVICLLGNHESMAIAAITRGGRAIDHWLQNGGYETVKSYGIDKLGDFTKEHLEWMKQLPLFYEDEYRFYVHAGVDPDLQLDQQNPADLIWIRNKFLYSNVDFGKTVVHGHTPTKSKLPEFYHNRIAIDTLAYDKGKPLTAVKFDRTQDRVDGYILQYENYMDEKTAI